MKRFILSIVFYMTLTGIAGADVSGQNVELIQASATGSLTGVEAALRAGVDINVKDAINGTTALMLAAQNGHTDVVRFLIEKGADVNEKKTTNGTTDPMPSQEKDKIDDIEAYKAVKNKIIFKLIGEMMDIQLLLTKVTDPNANTIKGYLDEIYDFIRQNDEVIVKNPTDGGSALWMASKNGHTDIVKILIEKGARVNAKNAYGITALMLALDKDYTDIIKLLIDNNADINIKAIDGTTTLMMASSKGNIDIVNLLIQKGAWVNAKTDNGITALWMATQNGHTDVVKLLIENGAGLDIKATNGSTALMPAAQNGNTEIVKMLCEYGADPNIKATIDNVEYTALKTAINTGQRDIMGILESIGAKE